MNIDFHFADFLKLPVKVFAALALATGIVLFSPDFIIKKLYLESVRDRIGSVIGIVFVVSISIVLISILLALIEFVMKFFYRIKFKLNSEKSLKELDDYQKFIIYGLYCQYNHTDELPLNDGAVRSMEQKRMIGKVTNQYLVMDVNNAVFPYLLQPWVVTALNKHNDLRDSFKESFELVSAQLQRRDRNMW